MIHPYPVEPLEGYQEHFKSTRTIWYYTRPVVPGLEGEVLDVGSGASPHEQATVLCDLYPEASEARDRDHTELLIPEGKRFVPGDVQDLPFEDNSFSFVFCLHLLEHVDDPVRACQELQRVAPRGLIETPHAVLESCYDTPSHRWLVDLIDGVLVFVRKPERGAWRKIPHTHFPLHLFPQVVGFEFGYMRALWERPFLVEVRDAW